MQSVRQPPLCGATSPRACSTTCYADCGVLVSLQYRSRMFPSYALQYHCDPIKHAWHMSAAAASSWLSDKSSQFEIPCHGKRCVRFNAAQYLFRLRELLRWCRRGKVPPFGAIILLLSFSGHKDLDLFISPIYLEAIAIESLHQDVASQLGLCNSSHQWSRSAHWTLPVS